MTSPTSLPIAAQCLEQIERLIAEGQQQIVQQRQFVADMEQAALLAREVLASFEDAQALRLAERDRLLKELQDARLIPQGS